ncbi:putative pleckstrin domain, protein kinase-like domain superfamily, Zinc finger, FYVE/PHD-type [Plasmopara halstedii]
MPQTFAANMTVPSVVDFDELLPETPLGAIGTLRSAHDKAQALMRAQEPPQTFGGYLRKRFSSSMYMGSWRYCVLQGARLRWYRSKECAETDTQLRGEVWVQSIEPWDGRSTLSSYRHTFAVRTTSKRLLLCAAETHRDLELWLQQFERALQRTKNTAELLAAVHCDEGGRRIVPEDMRRPLEVLPPPIPCAFQERPAGGSDVTSILSASSEVSYGQSLSRGDTGCAECYVRFRPLVTRRVVCGSCARAFCARHCHRGIRLQHLGLRATRRCCNHCAQRQEFIGYLRATKRYIEPMASRGISMDALVARSDVTRRNQVGRDTLARTLYKLRHGPMTLNRTIKILYQTRKKAHLFRVACERLPFYTETCVDRVENLWYQLLHLVQCLDAEPAPLSVVQLFYLQRYIRAICRRCPRIALQTIWHVQASVGDGNDHNLHPHTLLALLGFIYPNTTLPESSRVFSIWKDLVFADCPEHQLAQILADLREINSQMERMILLEPDSMIERWLNARSVPEFKDCAAELMASGIELCEFQSNILYDSLDIETDILGDESSGSAIESLVLEQVSFVQSLAAISERLRHVQPITDRSKYLAGELETLNNTLQSSALYPLSAASDELYQVVRIPPTEGKVFSTKMRAPTLIFVETVPVRRSGSLGTHDPKADHLRPFVFSSQPRNSTFFESARSDDIETSAVCSGGDGMLSPYMKSTLIPPTPGSSADGPTTCSDNSYSARDKCSACDLDEDVRQQDSLLSRNARRHTGVMPQSSRGIKMGTGARTRRLGGENFVYNSKVFGESWEDRKARIQHESPMGKLPGWNLFSVIVKTNDDLRQEVFTMQLIHKLQSIFEFEAPHLWLRTYRIVATGANIGLLETITDACSLDHLKKTFPGGNLLQYFRSVYGDPSSADFLAAQRRFIESMAAYSLVSYVLLLKDRHNGNILLSSEGRIIHIDFGFILGIAPGGIFSLEDAPFKLTKEMVDVMGGLSSPGYLYFRRCLYEGILVLQKYEAEIVALLQTTGQHSPFPCFHGTKLTRVISSLRSRLCVGLSRRGTQICVDYLLRKSYNSWGTRKYDSFQFRSNNIYM